LSTSENRSDRKGRAHYEFRTDISKRPAAAAAWGRGKVRGVLARVSKFKNKISSTVGQGSIGKQK